MSAPYVTVVLVFAGIALIPLGIWTIGLARRSRQSMAPLAGMMLLLGAFLTADPPPPPPAESATPRADDQDETGEPKDPV